MTHYNFAEQFGKLYDQAVLQYAKGQRGADTFFDQEQRQFLTRNGLFPQNLFDYAEDHHGTNGEPGFGIALTIETVRRDYFLNVQGGRPSTKVLEESSLPPKSDTVQGIEWLPRIIPKARAKLRGELPASLMYCCGGDRKFLKANDIFPAGFLALVWRHEKDDAAVIDWVVRRRSDR
jgi:hypothetical protein